MSAAGHVTTGFSKPYVALYGNTGTTLNYTDGRLLARGVSASASIETSTDNDFYADNILAESAPASFTSGDLTLTVDGLFVDAERMIMGLPAAAANGFTAYGDDQAIPFVGVGFIVRHQSAGEITYQAMIFPKVQFELISTEANTQEETIDWQTQELTAAIKRADDAARNWKQVGTPRSTEAAAEQDIKPYFAITE